PAPPPPPYTLSLPAALPILNIAGQPGEVETAGTRVAHIIENRIGAPQLRFGQGLRVGRGDKVRERVVGRVKPVRLDAVDILDCRDRKSTRLNSSHVKSSYAV